jgi:hypothetical protein
MATPYHHKAFRCPDRNCLLAKKKLPTNSTPSFPSHSLHIFHLLSSFFPFILPQSLISLSLPFLSSPLAPPLPTKRTGHGRHQARRAGGARGRPAGSVSHRRRRGEGGAQERRRQTVAVEVGSGAAAAKSGGLRSSGGDHGDDDGSGGGTTTGAAAARRRR